MSDKEEEFNDEEDDFEFDPNQEFEEVEASTAPRSQLSQKQLMIAAGVGVFGLYILYSVFFGGSPDTPPPEPVAEAVVEEKQFEVAKPEVNEALSPEENKKEEDLSFDELASFFPAGETPKEEETKVNIESLQNTLLNNNQDNTKVEEGLTTLSERLDNNVTQLDNLEATINGVADSLVSLTDSLEKMDKRISNLSDRMGSVSSELKKIKQEVGEDIEEVSTLGLQDEKQTLVYNGPEYVVHAILPGRAWLKSSKGQIVTVSEGDVLGDYGKILVVDSKDGIVLTSSGISFR